MRSSADFFDTVKSIRRGEFLDRINEQLTELNKAVFVTDGEGEITVTLAIKPNGEGQVVVKPKAIGRDIHERTSRPLHYGSI